MPVVVPAPTAPGSPPVGSDTWNVVLDPSQIATGRAQFLLNYGPIRIDQKGIDWGDAAITAFESDMRIGSEAVDYRIPNRTVTIPLFLGADESGQEEVVRSQLQQKVALFQREGGFILRQRAGGPNMYADVVNATLTLPDVYGETGWVEPNVVLQCECLPDFYSDEVPLDTMPATGVFNQVLTQNGTQALIEGDSPGRTRIIVADTSNNAQLGLLWGVRSRYYDPAATAQLWYEAEAMTPQNGAAVVALAGASGGNVVRLASLPAATFTTVLTTDLGGVGSLTHRGTYRVWARCYTTAASPPSLRFQWNVGSLAVPVTNPGFTLQGSNNFYLVDLGDIRVIPPPTGTYSWTGGVQAQPVTAGDNVSIDALYFVPVDESAGKLEINTTVSGDVVIYELGQVEMRYDGMFRPDPETASWGAVSTVIGDLPRIPPSGLEDRVCELFVRPTRGALETLPDSGIDSFSVQVIYRPTYIHRP